MSAGRWSAYAAIVHARIGGASVDTDRDWKARIRAAGPLALARVLGGWNIAGGRFGPCPACSAKRTSSDTRPSCHEYVSDRDGTRLWRCRACKVTGDAVGFAARAALGGGEARDPEAWAAVRRWLAAAGVVAADPADPASPADAARRPVRRLEVPEGPAVVYPPPDEVAALWESCVPVTAGALPVTGAPAVHPHALEVVGRVVRAAGLDTAAGFAAVGSMARVQPGGGPPGGWPAWLPPGLTVERRLVLPAVDAAGQLRSVRFVHTAPARPLPAAGLCGLPSGSSTLDAAVVAALDGFRVIPLYGVADGRCTCPEGGDCTRPGKHPALRGWPDRATTDEAQLRSWWQARPASNVGIVTGRGLVVLDVDGPAGESSLAALVERHGPLPVTLEVRSGRVGGGRHLYFTWPGWTCPTTHASQRARLPGGDPLGAGLDVRGDGGNGLVVAPGSRHASGAIYSVTRPVPVAVAPSWFLELVGRETAADPAGFGSDGLCHASPGALAWLRSGRAAPRVVVVPAESWLAYALRRPEVVVVGVWAPSCWSAALADRVADGGEVVVADPSVVDRVEHTSRGRFRVRRVA